MLLCQARHRYACLAGLLRQAPLEFDRMIRPPFARRPFGFIGQFGSHYLFGGNYFGFSGLRRPDGSGTTLTFQLGLDVLLIDSWSERWRTDSSYWNYSLGEKKGVQVFELMAAGKSLNAIAEGLSLSAKAAADAEDEDAIHCRTDPIRNEA